MTTVETALPRAEEVDASAHFDALVIRAVFRSSGRELLQSPAVSALTSVIDPLTAQPAPPPHRRLIVGAWHDRMAMHEPALELLERWGGQFYW